MLKEFDQGTDPDDIIMSMDRRSLLEQIKDYLKSKIENKGWDQGEQKEKGSQVTPENPML